MNNYAPTLAGVVGRLNQARLRLVAQGALNAAFWAATCGLAIFALFELLRRLQPAQEYPSVAVSAVGAAAVILICGVVIAIVRAPPIEQLARRADYAFGLRERISTALEVERRTIGPRPAVVAAMIADALRQGDAVNPAKLAAFRLPRSALLVPLAAIAAAAVIAVGPTMPGSAGTPPVPYELSATLNADQRATAVENISRVADAIKQEAVARDDPYMQAVANTLEDLSERVALNPETTHQEIAQELDTLLNYATAAGSEWRGSTGERIPQLIGALDDSIALSAGQPMTAMTGEAAPDEATTPAIDPMADPALAAENIDSLLDELQGNGAAQTGTPNPSDATPNLVDNLQAAQGQATASRDENQNADNAPSLRSKADPEAVGTQPAGEGTADIGTGPVAQKVDFDTTSKMVLTGEDAGEGRHLKIEITPNTSLTEIADQSLAVNVDAWRRTTEAEDQRYAIGIDDRDTVSRYLHALLGPAEK